MKYNRFSDGKSRVVHLLATIAFAFPIYLLSSKETQDWYLFSTPTEDGFNNQLITTQDRYLISTPREDGFNNQLITIYRNIICARNLNRTIVLPLMYENVRYDTSAQGPYPFEDYFKVQKLTSVVNYTTFAQFKSRGFPCRRIGYNKRIYKSKKKRLPKLLSSVYRRLGWRFRISLLSPGGFYSDVPCIDDTLCKKSNELGLYGNYSNGQGYSIKNSVEFRNIRKAMEPSEVVLHIANVTQKMIGGKFNAMHIRRGDYKNKCKKSKQLCDEFGVESFYQSKEWILESIKRYENPELSLFISTTHDAECKTFFKRSGKSVFTMSDVKIPDEIKWALKRTDIMSYASQIVASKAEEFIGNRFSSYTSTINSMRMLRDNSSEPQFF